MANQVISSTFVVGGAVQASDGLYLTRDVDTQLPALCRAGAFVYLLTSRQMGKSSLIENCARILAQEKILCATIDLSGFGTHNTSSEQWYFGLILRLAKELELTTNVSTWWKTNSDISSVQRFSKFVTEALATIDNGVVIAIDEIDTTLQLPFADDFFAAIRALYGERAKNPLLRNLSIVLVGVATPAELISDSAKTPFNIGTRIDLTDFTRQEIQPLAQGFDLADGEASDVLDWVYEWTKGHPFLTQRLCYEIARYSQQQWTEVAVAEVVKKTFFGATSGRDSNLQIVRDMLIKRPSDPMSVLALYREVCRGADVPDRELSEAYAHLKLSGVVRSENGYLKVRNPIYEHVFSQEWAEEQLKANLLAEPLRRWLEKERHPDYVLRGQALVEAQEWARGRTFLTSEEQAFLTASAQVELAEKQIALELAEKQHALELAEKQRTLELAEKQHELGLAQQQVKAEQERRERAEALSRMERRWKWAMMVSVPLLIGVLGLGLVTKKLSADLVGKLRELKSADRRLQDLKIELFGKQSELNTMKAAIQPLKSDLTKATNDLVTKRQELHNVEIEKNNAVHDKNIALTDAKKANDDKNKADKRRKFADRATEAARGQTAFLLATQPGRELEALRMGIEAVRPLVQRGETVPIQTITGISASIASVTNGLPLIGHNSQVYSANFSSHGHYLITAGEDNTARIWDATRGKLIWNLPIPNKINPNLPLRRVRYAAFSPNEKWAVTLSKDVQGFSPVVQVWNVQTGKLQSALKITGTLVRSIAFSPNGITLLTVENGSINVWNVQDGSRKFTLESPDNIHSDSSYAEFSPDGKWIAAARLDGLIRIWYANTGKIFKSFKFENLIKAMDIKDGIHQDGMHLSTVYDPPLVVAFSPDSGRIVAASSHRLFVWDLATEKLNMLRAAPDPNLLVGDKDGGSFSPNLHTEIDENLIIPKDSHPIQTSHAFLKPNSPRNVVSAMFSDDGKRLLWIGAKGITVWDTAKENQIAVCSGYGGMLGSAAISPDGQWATAISEHQTVYLWDAESGRLFNEFSLQGGQIDRASFSPDSKRLAIADSTGIVRLQDIRCRPSIAMLHVSYRNEDIHALSPDGKYLATASRAYSNRYTIHLWDVLTSSMYERTFGGHTENVSSLSFSRDGKWMVSTGRDGRVIRHCLVGTIPDLTLGGHHGPALSLAFSTDGMKIATTGMDGSVQILSMKDGSLLNTLYHGMNTAVTNALFSPDGRWIVTTSEIIPSQQRANPFPMLDEDAPDTVRVWDVNRGVSVFTYTEGRAKVRDIRFSPDGSRIVAGFDDRKIRVLDIKNRKVMRVIPQTYGVNFVAFASNERSIVAVTDRGAACFYDADTGVLLKTLGNGTAMSRHAGLSPDGSAVLVVNGENTLELWDVASGLRLSKLIIPKRDKASGMPGSASTPVLMSNNGDRIVEKNIDGGLVWDTQPERLIKTSDSNPQQLSQALLHLGERLMH